MADSGTNAQLEQANAGNTYENPEARKPESPQQQRSGSFDEKMSRHSSERDVKLDDYNNEVARSNKDDDSVKIPIDSVGMESVDLESTGKGKSDQPRSGRSSKASKKKSKKKEDPAIDFVNRDPENLQEAVKVNFADIIAEPSGAHSFNTIWGSSFKVYSLTKFWLYRILTLVFGVPLALIWGIYFSCLAFLGIWWIMPCLRAIRIKMNFVSQLWSLCIRTWLDPIFESLGLILSRIRIMLTLRRD